MSQRYDIGGDDLKWFLDVECEGHDMFDDKGDIPEEGTLRGVRVPTSLH